MKNIKKERVIINGRIRREHKNFKNGQRKNTRIG